MSSTRSKVLIGLAVGALVASGCRGGADGGGVTTDPAASPDEGERISTDVGVTADPCPDAVNRDNGCIYLGTISDLTEGPFVALAVPLTEAQRAFWRRINEGGGIGGYDIDVTTYVGDNKYNPELHNQVYQELKDDVLAFAQTLGGPHTASIIEDLRANDIVASPASWTSLWAFEEVILESGSNYCYEAMNFVDYAVDELGAQSVLAVHYPGDAGDDGAAGAKIAAENRGIDYTGVPTTPGPDNQGGAIDQIVSIDPDVVVIVSGPSDMAVIVGQAVARGYGGTFLGANPTWNPALLDSAAAEALKDHYLLSSFWAPFDGDTEGHKAMRDAVGDVQPNDGYIFGWTWSYPLKAAIEKAIENGDLTRRGLMEAGRSLETVDYEGILPPEAGNFTGQPGTTAFRQTLLLEVDEEAPTGVRVIRDFSAGPSAESHDLDQACYLM